VSSVPTDPTGDAKPAVEEGHINSWRDMILGRLDHHSERLVLLEEHRVTITRRVLDLEEDREMARRLSELTERLASRVDQIATTVPTIAEQAADNVLARKARARRDNFKHNIGYVAAAAGACGSVIGVVVAVFHYFH
jgi:hypothetical protein